jgi:hypothetical protein
MMPDVIATIVTPFGRARAAVGVDDNQVYWLDVDQGSINFCAKTGCDGGVHAIVKKSVPSTLYVDPSGVYWAIAGAPNIVYRSPLEGAGQPSPVAFPAAPAFVITANSQCVYWSSLGDDPTGSVGSVFAAPQPP